MDAPAPESPLLASRAARVTLVMSCMFGTFGMILVFLPRWLEVERGLSGAEIGAVLSLAQLARILTGSAIAFWADGAADRRMPIRVVSMAAVAAYAAFYFVADGFWQLLVFGFIALSLTQAMTPLIEAAALRATATGAIPYGVARGIGSISFIAANILGGVLIARFGLVAVVVWTLTGLAIAAASSWLALKPDPPTQPPSGARFGAVRGLLASRRYLILVLACGLVQSGHAFYYSFSALVWRAQGLSPEMVGVLWAFGVAVEVAFLWSLVAIERRLSPEALIVIGAAGGALRWLLLGFGPTGWMLWPLQALHALSFAPAHVGAMRLLHRESPEHAAVMAQTLYAAVSGGLLMGAATLWSGFLYDEFLAGGYWGMFVLTFVGGALALLLLRSAPNHPLATRD